MTEQIPKPSVATDVVRWVETDITACDPLTKKMEGAKLTNAMDSNYWDLRQPHEALMKKRIKQAQRRRARDDAEPARKAKAAGESEDQQHSDAEPAHMQEEPG